MQEKYDPKKVKQLGDKKISREEIKKEAESFKLSKPQQEYYEHKRAEILRKQGRLK